MQVVCVAHIKIHVDKIVTHLKQHQQRRPQKIKSNQNKSFQEMRVSLYLLKKSRLAIFALLSLAIADADRCMICIETLSTNNVPKQMCQWEWKMLRFISMKYSYKSAAWNAYISSMNVVIHAATLTSSNQLFMILRTSILYSAFWKSTSIFFVKFVFTFSISLWYPKKLLLSKGAYSPEQKNLVSLRKLCKWFYLLFSLPKLWFLQTNVVGVTM